MSNAIRCKRTGQGIAMKLDGGWCMCPSVDECALMTELRVNKNTWPFERRFFFKLPVDLRQRWWRETHFSKEEPSKELLAEVVRVLSEQSDGIVIARS
jgi:hypothetical protein